MVKFLDSNNIKCRKYQGQERLDGNLWANFVKKHKEQPNMFLDPVPYVQVIKEGCFGKTLSIDYKD